jgi:hypothetical protein
LEDTIHETQATTAFETLSRKEMEEPTRNTNEEALAVSDVAT